MLKIKNSFLTALVAQGFSEAIFKILLKERVFGTSMTNSICYKKNVDFNKGK